MLCQSTFTDSNSIIFSSFSFSTKDNRVICNNAICRCSFLSIFTNGYIIITCYI